MTSTTAVTTGGASLPLELLAGALDAGPGSAVAPGGTPRTTAARATATEKASRTAKAASAPKAPAAKKASTSKKTTSAKSSTTKAAGYATKLPADYAFLRDPRISIEEKLSRFIGMLMAKSEQDLLRQMEKMAPGSTANAAGATGSTGGAATAKPAAKKVSIWGLAKSILPPLGMASQLVGDAALKKLVQQLSGPVLGAAATALGGPALGALASQLGPTIGELVTRDVKVDLSGLASLVGLDAGTTASAKAAGTSATTASTAGAADGTASEKAQLMELQRLQDRDKELFTLFSNMLKAMHDARMTSIQNLR